LKLHSRCYPDNYWFAKSSLDRAYEICLSCESSYRASKRDLEALAEVKKGVETMLHVHTTQYREHWKSKGKNPPTEDEWYEIAEAEEDETRGSAGDWLEVAKDENGVALSGPVKAWPFEGPGKRTVPLAFLLYLSDLGSAGLVSRGKDLPSESRARGAMMEGRSVSATKDKVKEVEGMVRGLSQLAQRALRPADLEA